MHRTNEYRLCGVERTLSERPPGRATRNVIALAEARISEVLRWPLDNTELATVLARGDRHYNCNTISVA
jgi:hypothetical protein